SSNIIGMHRFKVNEYISLKLINIKTVVFVNGEEFLHCKHLLLDLTKDSSVSFENIDKLEEKIYFITPQELI
ncbi:MAG: hypothetical protein ACFFG0_57005, partial [Candidatus Thorarchaeota archaeon]